MKYKSLLLSMALLFGGTCSVAARGADDPRLNVTTETTPDGHVLFKVENLSVQPITAMVLVVTHTYPDNPGHPGQSLRYFDSLISSDTERDVMQYQTHTFTLPRISGPHAAGVRSEPALKAAIFADGSSYGDPQWVNRLVLGRKAASQDLEDAIKMLQSAKASGASGESLAKEVADAKSAKVKEAQVPEERMAAGQVYDTIAWSLKSDATRAPSAGALSVAARIDELISRFTRQQQRLSNSKPSVVASGLAASVAS